MKNTEHNWTGTILLGIFVVLIGWYFLTAYIDHGKSPQIQEKLLTVHDDLFAIDGPDNNNNKTAVGKFGLILLTQDGGKVWQRQRSGTVKALSAVSFADDKNGFIVGSGGTLLATKDGGGSWVAQKSGTQEQLLGVYAVNPLRVFAVGAFGTLLSTSDGGANWSKHELKWDALIEQIVKEAGFVEPNLNAIYFNSSESGWIVGEFGLVIHTKDGGKTWISQRYGQDLPQLYAIQFQDDRAWAIGQAGSVIQTRDGGQRWSSVELETMRDLYDISLDGDRGVIVGDGVVFVSNDRGSKWRSMGLNRDDRWFAGVILKSSEAIAVGQAGTTELISLDNTGLEKERTAR